MIQCNDVPEQPVIDYLVDYVYLIEKSGRKWLTGRLDRPGKRPLLDKILINKVSSNWQVGETHRIIAIHRDRPTEYGHNVVIIPLEELSVCP